MSRRFKRRARELTTISYRKQNVLFQRKQKQNENETFEAMENIEKTKILKRTHTHDPRDI